MITLHSTTSVLFLCVCADVNECVEAGGGLCENGVCVNTRGSYSCVCRSGFILDASHGLCICESPPDPHTPGAYWGLLGA